MIYCANCGTVLDNDSVFCSSCGAKIKKQEKDYSVFKPNIEKINAYGPYKPKAHIPTILTGIFALFFGINFIFVGFRNIIFFIAGILFAIMGIYMIFISKKAGIKSIFRKQSKKLFRGMDINEVRAIMAFIKPINEGINRDGEYCIYYSTNIKDKKNADYEAIFLKFDSNAKLLSCEKSYKRTTTTYY